MANDDCLHCTTCGVEFRLGFLVKRKPYCMRHGREKLGRKKCKMFTAIPASGVVHGSS